MQPHEGFDVGDVHVVIGRERWSCRPSHFELEFGTTQPWLLFKLTVRPLLSVTRP